MKKRIMTLVLALCMIMTFMPQAVFASGGGTVTAASDRQQAYNVVAKNPVLNGNGTNLKSIDVSFTRGSNGIGVDVNGLLALTTKALNYGQNGSYGDFTDKGAVFELQFSNMSDVSSYKGSGTETKDNYYEIMSYTGTQLIQKNNSYNFTMAFGEEGMSLEDGTVYYVYLWVNNTYYYPDALVAGIKLDNGVLKYASAQTDNPDDLDWADAEVVVQQNLSIGNDEQKKYYENLTEAFTDAQDGDTITVEKNYSDGSNVMFFDEENVNKNITLNLNGKVISADNGNDDFLNITVGNGRLDIIGDGTYEGIINHQGGELVIDNGTFGMLVVQNIHNMEDENIPEPSTVLNGGIFKGIENVGEENLNGKSIFVLNAYQDDEDVAKNGMLALLGENKQYSSDDIKTGILSFDKDDEGQKNGRYAYFDEPVSVVEKHQHSFDETIWKSDKANHWNECVCGEKNNSEAHSFTWIIDKEPTATVPGSKHEKCAVCGYEKASVEIPATGGGYYPPVIIVDKEVEAVETLIKDIGTVDLSKADEIQAAREAYDKLKDYQQKNVENYKALTDAEAAMEDLLKQVSIIENDSVKIFSSADKGYIRIAWKQRFPEQNIDGVEVYRSTKENSEYEKISTFEIQMEKFYKKNLKKGTRYFYYVLGYKTIGGEKIYTKQSLILHRTFRK